MMGCHIGRMFQVTVAGGSYQDGLTAVCQPMPPGLTVTEQEVYGDLLLRKPGADELSSPRKEPDLPILYTGLNAADTVEDGILKLQEKKRSIADAALGEGQRAATLSREDLLRLLR